MRKYYKCESFSEEELVVMKLDTISRIKYNTLIGRYVRYFYTNTSSGTGRANYLGGQC